MTESRRKGFMVIFDTLTDENFFVKKSSLFILNLVKVTATLGGYHYCQLICLISVLPFNFSYSSLPLFFLVTVVMSGIEGPLCKWTNVVKGWQYRW